MPFRKTFSRPDISLWKPTPTLSSGAIRPFTAISPSVGPVTPASNRNIVVLPAPLRPITPSVSPL